MSGSVAYRAVGLAAALLSAALIARQLITVLLAVMIAVIISLPLSAAAGMAQRRGLPRVVGALAALVAVCGILVALGVVLIPEFAVQARQFAHRIPSIIHGADRSMHALTGKQTQNLSVQLTRFVNADIGHPDRLLGPLEQIGLQALGFLLVLVLAAFLIALNPEPLLQGGLRLLPEARRGQIREICIRVRVAWIGWLTAIAVDMVVLGGLLYVGMEIVGLPFALGFAVFSAFMTVIPNYGSIISAIPPILLGLSLSTEKAVLVAIVYVIVNQIEGNLILPLIMAQRVELPPAIVAIGVLAMAALFGVIGIVISVPLLSLIIIIVQVLWVEPQERSAEPAQTAGGR
jgi:predicted PurR-regulated permease PerM